MSAPRRIRDAVLPLLEAALDPAAVTGLLQELLPELSGPVELREVAIADVRYEPGSRAQILYRLKTRERDGGRSARPLLSMRLLPAGASPEPPVAAAREHYRGAGAGLRTGYAWDATRSIELTAYPLDRELTTLPDALDGAVVGAALGELWRSRNVLVRHVHVHPLGYTPDNRAAFGYDVLAEDRTTRVPELRRLIGKLHSKKPADRLFAGSWALWRAVRGQCRLAPPVGFLPALGLTLQEQVRGERLGGMAGDPAFGRRVRQTARALAALHAVQIPLATRRKPDEEARVVHRWSTVLMAIRPDLARRIERLRDRLAATLESRVQQIGPVHADFHHTNVLVDAEGVTIIDLDEMAFGDPLLDVGRFLASLRIPSLRAFGDLDALRDDREAFLEEYLRRHPEDERRVRLFEAGCLFTAAASAFRIQRPAWPEEVELLVDAAEVTFERSRLRPSSRGPRVPGPFPIVAERAAWARDPVYMGALLRQPLAVEYGMDLREIRSEADDRDPDAFHYQAIGRRNGERYSIDLVGAAIPSGGSALLQRLGAVRDALAAVPDAPELPRPVTFIRQLGLTVLELPRGERLSAALGTPAGAERIERVARGLAALHGVPVALDRTRPLHDDLQQIERRLDRLQRARPELYDRAASVIAAVREASRTLPERLTPALSNVRPNHVLWDGERVGFARVDTLVLGAPLLDVADFLARLTLVGLTRDDDVIPIAKARFRAAYRAAARVAAPGEGALEAAALVRLACNQLGATDARIPELLLREAAVALEAS